MSHSLRALEVMITEYHDSKRGTRLMWPSSLALVTWVWMGSKTSWLHQVYRPQASFQTRTMPGDELSSQTDWVGVLDQPKHAAVTIDWTLLYVFGVHCIWDFIKMMGSWNEMLTDEHVTSRVNYRKHDKLTQKMSVVWKQILCAQCAYKVRRGGGGVQWINHFYWRHRKSNLSFGYGHAHRNNTTSWWNSFAQLSRTTHC